MAFAVIFFAGCAKDIENIESSEISVRFNIAEKNSYGADTKAVKDSWTVGDQIRLAFSSDDVGNNFLQFANKFNTLSFRRNNDGTWQTQSTYLKVNDLNSSGVYRAVYYPKGVAFLGEQAGFTALDYKGGEYMYAVGEYEVVGDELILGTITMKRPEELMQVTVKKLATVEGPWTMTIEAYKNAPALTGVTHLKSGSIELNSQADINLNPNNYMGAEGVAYGDDLSFCFFVGDNSNLLDVTSESSPLNRAYSFIITNGVKTYKYSKITVDGLHRGTSYILQELGSKKDNSTDDYWLVPES